MTHCGLKQRCRPEAWVLELIVVSDHADTNLSDICLKLRH